MKKRLNIFVFAFFLILFSFSFVSAKWIDANGDNMNLTFLNNELIAFWDLDEGSGSAIDKVDGLYNLTTIGSETEREIAGFYNNSYKFNLSVNSYAKAENVGTIPFNESEGTIIGWYKSSHVSNLQSIFSYGDITGDNDYCIFDVRHTNNGQLELNCIVAGDQRQLSWKNSTNLYINDGNWHNLAIVYDRGNYYPYMDGVLLTSVITNYSASETYPTTWFNNITYMADSYGISYIPRFSGSSGFIMNGSIDNLAIYNRALNISEIMILADATQPMEFEQEIPLADTDLLTTLNSPIDNYKTNNQLITFNCTATSIIYPSNLTLIIDDAENLTITNSSGETELSIEVSYNLSEGIHNWSCYSEDTIGQNYTATRTLTKDTEPPFIFWINPSGNLLISGTEYNLTINFSDPYLDAVNISVYNSSNDEIYNNFSEAINVSDFQVLDTITLNEGLNTIEACARDSLTSSPKIRDLLKLTSKNQDAYDSYFDLELDNGVVIRRTTYIINNGGNKVHKGDYNLDITDNLDLEGRHIKTDITSDKLQNNNWGIRVDFECLKGCEYMEYLNDRGEERIVDSERNIYFQYNDAKLEGWDVKFSQEEDKASVIISYPDNDFYKSQLSRHTIDPIAGGLNSICESYNISVDTTSPIIIITYPTATDYSTKPNTLSATFIDENCDSIWYSFNLGVTNSSRLNCTNFTLIGLSSYVSEGSNTWIAFINDSFGKENSDNVTFTYTPIPFRNFPNEILGSGTIYELLRFSGAGLGTFLQYISLSLPNLLIDLALIFIILTIAWAFYSIIHHFAFKVKD